MTWGNAAREISPSIFRHESRCLSGMIATPISQRLGQCDSRLVSRPGRCLRVQRQRKKIGKSGETEKHSAPSYAGAFFNSILEAVHSSFTIPSLPPPLSIRRIPKIDIHGETRRLRAVLWRGPSTLPSTRHVSPHTQALVQWSTSTRHGGVTLPDFFDSRRRASPSLAAHVLSRSPCPPWARTLPDPGPVSACTPTSASTTPFAPTISVWGWPRIRLATSGVGLARGVVPAPTYARKRV
ncbi:hypothetical protein R3P38DRAFT_3167429 [Favolaschia claudopus]|uniref:Uncharacterized protein n=1 Tax=Favolaschia claudopus TaxID=2862362 RepID=A0AAW0EGB6_9AGAR